MDSLSHPFMITTPSLGGGASVAECYRRGPAWQKALLLLLLFYSTHCAHRISIATMVHSFLVALKLSLAGYLGSGGGGEPVVHNTLGFLLFRKPLSWKKKPRGLKEEGGTFPPKSSFAHSPTMHRGCCLACISGKVALFQLSRALSSTEGSHT